MDMRVAESRARRERHDNRTEPPTRASADNHLLPLNAPSSCFRASLLPCILPPSSQIKCHTMQSNRRSDKDRRPERVRRGGRAEGSLEPSTLSRE